MQYFNLDKSLTPTMTTVIGLLIKLINNNKAQSVQLMLFANDQLR